MKQRHLKRVLCWALTLVILAPALPTVSHATQTEEEFYSELAKLIQADDTESFFDTMELTIGSSVLTVDGEEETLDAAPAISDSRTMLPIRAVAENAGAEVDYEPASKTVIISNDYGDVVRCPVGENTMTVNDSICDLDVAAYIDESSGRTYLPVRAVAEALNLEVGWNQQSSTVTFAAPYQTARLVVLADQLDTRGLGAETVISDGTGMWVLQFAAPAQAKEATATLEARGIIAEPDRYIPPIEDISGVELSVSGSHYSWGAENCGFDSFVGNYSSQFTGRDTVAVVDSGVDSSHPFLRGRVLSNGYDFIDGDSVPNDGSSHGTHVAGTIIDCVGSAPVNVLPVRVLNNQGKGTDLTVSAGIKYAANHGADIINLSLGGGCSRAIDSAVSYAIGKGCLVVVAAGNDNQNTANYSPAHITSPGVVVVSAGDTRHAKACFSNYGNSVDLMAPGVSILAAVPNGGYKYMGGTSMATPPCCCGSSAD